MSSEIFGTDYARAYDLWYEDKDYEKECDLIEEIFRRYSTGDVRSILDLGCGTGGHAIPMARRGYAVTGVDRSEAMLAIARQKADAEVWGEGLAAPTFIHADLLDLDIGRRFDAVLMMFAVLGYQTTDESLTRALAAVRRHLVPGGVFTGDVWYAPAVLTIKPSERVRVIQMGEVRLVRTAEVTIDSQHHLCTVQYKIREVLDQAVIAQHAEDHHMRFFFPQELDYFLQTAGLQPVALLPFPDLDGLPSEQTWNVIFCSRALPD